MNKIEISSDWIDRYVENELTETEREHFLEMLRVSPVLKAELSVDQDLNQLLTDQDALAFYKNLQSFSHAEHQTSWINPILLMAASVVVLFSVGLLILLNRHQNHLTKQYSKAILRDDKSLLQTNSATRDFLTFTFDEKIKLKGLKNITGQPILAATYKPLPEFESLVGTTTRSFPLKLISPPSEIHIPKGEKVAFQWDKNLTFPELKLTILNNDGREVMDIEMDQTNHYWLSTTDLPLGLYYWRITSEDNFLTMGKMIIL